MKTLKKIWKRCNKIELKDVGNIVGVHNGRNFIKVKVTKDMVGTRWGSFSYTRARFSFKKTKKKN